MQMVTILIVHES